MIRWMCTDAPAGSLASAAASTTNSASRMSAAIPILHDSTSAVSRTDKNKGNAIGRVAVEITDHANLV